MERLQGRKVVRSIGARLLPVVHTPRRSPPRGGLSSVLCARLSYELTGDCSLSPAASPYTTKSQASMPQPRTDRTAHGDGASGARVVARIVGSRCLVMELSEEYLSMLRRLHSALLGCMPLGSRVPSLRNASLYFTLSASPPMAYSFPHLAATGGVRGAVVRRAD